MFYLDFSWMREDGMDRKYMDFAPETDFHCTACKPNLILPYRDHKP